MADTRWNIRKIADHCRPGLKVAKMDWMTKLVSADGGDVGVAIVDARGR